MTDYAQGLAKLKSSAMGAATVRAFAHLEPDPRVRNADHLAREFLEPDRRPPVDDPQAVANFRAQLEAVLPGAYGFQNARTKHVDARMKQAVADGIQQVVMLGAGFDTRAYRLGRPDGDVRFFEIDLPALQAEKIEKIETLFGGKPAQVEFVPLDFNTDPLDRILAAPGFDPARPAFFNWEGVSYYLTANGVDATLRFVGSRTAPGSRILFDYMPRSMVDGSGEYYGGAESRAYMAKFGEPLLFGVEDGAISKFLSDRGFDLNTHFTPHDLEQAYLIDSQGQLHCRVAGYAYMAEAIVRE